MRDASSFLSVRPRDLDVVERDDEFVLFAGKAPLSGLDGEEVAHPSRRAVEHVFREVLRDGGVDFARPGGARLLTALRRAEDTRPLENRPTPPPECDLLVGWTGAPRSDSGQVDPETALAFIEKHEEALPLACACAVAAAAARRAMRGRLKEKGVGLDRLVLELSPEARCAISLLEEAHQSGAGLPFLLVVGVVTPSEYAHALYGLHSPLVASPEAPPFVEDVVDWERPFAGLAALREEAANLVELLACLKSWSGPEEGILALIRQGESDHLEFKSTLRMNLHTRKNDAAIEHACLKSVAAFLNTDGGDLLIGVADSGEVLGLEADLFLSEDHLARHFWNLVKSALGQDLAPYVRTRFETAESRRILRVSCRRSPKPVFLVQKGAAEEFYIRIGPSSEKLGILDALRYTAHRFAEAPGPAV